MIVPPTTDEIEAIMAVVAPHLKRCIVLANYCGMRPGAVEMLSLTWRHVLWGQNIIITIENAAKGKLTNKKTRRSVPIHQDFLSLLKEWRDQDNNPDGPIIHYHGKPIKKIQTSWENAVKRSGIERRIRPYDLRHRFITQALADGADIKALSGIVGSIEYA